VTSVSEGAAAFRAVLSAMDLADRPEELPVRQRMIELIDVEPRCFHRDAFPAHFTGSALVVNGDGSMALLHHHRKLDRWLQFGGHCDGDPDLLQVALREAVEESGIEGLIVPARRPFDLDIHPIPPLRGEQAHEHYDVRYMFIAPEDAQPVCSDESRELRWFTPAEMIAVAADHGLRRLAQKWEALVNRRHAASRLA
jgi:8-oxo-dGTP pyrophosphatase MutT (NUDIX family)